LGLNKTFCGYQEREFRQLVSQGQAPYLEFPPTSREGFRPSAAALRKTSIVSPTSSAGLQAPTEGIDSSIQTEGLDSSAAETSPAKEAGGGLSDTDGALVAQWQSPTSDSARELIHLKAVHLVFVFVFVKSLVS
jgi:hypothetical protein